MTAERTETLKSFDGSEIFFRCFTPKKRDQIAGLVLAVHGFGEHSGRYAEVAQTVCNKGMAFACFDLRGHGRSGPSRGDAENLHAMILDVLFVVNHARSLLGIANRPEAFYGIVGHSFGGLLVTHVAAILNVFCPPIFLSSPCYQIAQELPSWKKWAAKSLPFVAPGIPVPIGIEPAFLSKNAANNDAYGADELNLSFVTPRLGNILINALNDEILKNSISLIKTNVKIVAGADDELVKVNKTESLFRYFDQSHSSLTLIEGAGHEIFNELPIYRSQAFQQLEAWIDSRGEVR